MAKKSAKPKKPLSEKQRGKDEELRDSLRHFDEEKFKGLLTKAIRPVEKKGD